MAQVALMVLMAQMVLAAMVALAPMAPLALVVLALMAFPSRERLAQTTTPREAVTALSDLAQTKTLGMSTPLKMYMVDRMWQLALRVMEWSLMARSYSALRE